jgi:hypothetical protein
LYDYELHICYHRPAELMLKHPVQPYLNYIERTKKGHVRFGIYMDHVMVLAQSKHTSTV